MFERWAQVQKKNEELQSRIAHLEASNKSYQGKARQTKEMAQAEKEEAHRLKDRAEGYLSAIRQKDAEVLRLKDALAAKDKQASFSTFLMVYHA